MLTKSIKLAAIIALAGASSALAQVDTYPNKPIRWVIPFAPGGGTDMVARPIASKLTDRLGQQILYDNRGGGGGIIAGEIVAKANPDGYTLLVAAVAVMTVTGTLQKMPFDPIRDFTLCLGGEWVRCLSAVCLRGRAHARRRCARRSEGSRRAAENGLYVA